MLLSLEQFERACLGRWLGGNGLILCLKHGQRVGAEKNLSGPAGRRPELNASTVIATQAATGDGNTFGLQKAFGKAGIEMTHIGQASDHSTSAKKLCLQSLSPCAASKQGIHEELHGMDAVSRRWAGRTRFGILIVLTGKEKMIHAAETADRVPQAGGDAGAEDRGQHRLGIVINILLALNNMDAQRTANGLWAFAHALCTEA